MKKGDIVANTHQSDGNPYKHQMVVGTFCGKGAMTIDYMGNSHRFDNAQEHMEVVGHLKEYDDYMNALKRLSEYKEREPIEELPKHSQSKGYRKSEQKAATKGKSETE